jgi:hypothetical protein
MFTAEEDKAGRAPTKEEPSAGWVETERAPKVLLPNAGAVRRRGRRWWHRWQQGGWPSLADGIVAAKV